VIKDFEYFAPKTLKEALALLDKYGDDCKVVCGGAVPAYFLLLEE
jgi:CO/xanthine dehydrogenase FAD-binding subunit